MHRLISPSSLSIVIRYQLRLPSGTLRLPVVFPSSRSRGIASSSRHPHPIPASYCTNDGDVSGTLSTISILSRPRCRQPIVILTTSRPLVTGARGTKTEKNTYDSASQGLTTHQKHEAVYCLHAAVALFDKKCDETQGAVSHGPPPHARCNTRSTPLLLLPTPPLPPPPNSRRAATNLLLVLVSQVSPPSIVLAPRIISLKFAPALCPDRVGGDG